MATHKHFLGKIFGTVWDSIKEFFTKAWHNADHDLLEFAILVTEGLKEGLQSGVVKSVVDGTPTQIDNAILGVANTYLPKLLADELLLKDLNENSSEADVKTVAEDILRSFGGLTSDKKEEFYTSVSAKLYVLVMQAKHGVHITFGQAAQLVEAAYQEYVNSK